MKLRFASDSIPGDLLVMQEIWRRRRPVLRILAKTIQGLPSATIDLHVHRHATRATADISCTECGNCCRSLEPALADDEAIQLANVVDPVAPRDWLELHTEPEPGGTYRIMRAVPCCLLKGNLCSAYHFRPVSCADYPHLYSPGQKYRFRSTMAQYAICPIVFRTVEALISDFIPEYANAD